ncbi:MAG: CvpA family protein [Chloroflexota bacterium]
MTLAGLNNLDLLLIVFLFIGVMIGFVRGILPQLISLASIWLGLVATLWLYKLFSERIIQDALGLGETGGDTLAFLTLLVIFFNAFRLIVRALSTPPEERRKKRRKDPDDPLAEAAKSFSERMAGFVNALGGMVLGFVLTMLWLALLLGVLQFIFQPTGTDVPYSGFAGGLVTNLRTSFLRPYFNSVLWLLSQSVDLFIPKNADIFRTVLRTIVETTG